MATIPNKNEKPTPEQRLKRFLYLNSEQPRFVSGDPERYDYYQREKLTFLNDIFANDKLPEQKIEKLNFIESVANLPTLPYRKNVIYAISSMIKEEGDAVDQNVKHELYVILERIIQTPEELFTFIKFHVEKSKNCKEKPAEKVDEKADENVNTKRHIFPSGMRKLFVNYYFNRDPMELIKIVTEQSGYFGWKHKDVFRCIHYKEINQLYTTVIQYVLFGIERAETEAESSGELKGRKLEILAHAKKMKEFKSCKDGKKLAEMMGELDVRHVHQLPPETRDSVAAWEALIPRLSFEELLRSIPGAYRSGLLKDGTRTRRMVLDILKDEEAIIYSMIHPADVFVVLMNLKRGKPKDPHFINYLEKKGKLENKQKKPDDAKKKPNAQKPDAPKTSKIIDAVQRKTLRISYDNLGNVPRNCMVVVVGNSNLLNEHCLTTKNVFAAEAAAFIVTTFLLCSKCVVYVLAGHRFKEITLPKDHHLDYEWILKQIKSKIQVDETEKGDCLKNLHEMFQHVIRDEPDKTDAFVTLMAYPYKKVKSDCEQAAAAFENVRVCYNKYAEETKIRPKFIVNELCDYKTKFNLDFAPTDYLEVCGFDHNTVKVMQNFCLDLF